VHDDGPLVRARVERELWERLLPAVHAATAPLRVEAWHAPGEPVTFAEARAQRFQPFQVGDAWGRPWGTTWFRCSADVPAGWAGPRLEAVVDLGFHRAGPGFQAEGLVWTDEGPLQGVHPMRTGVPLPEAPAGPLTFLVEAAANPAFPQFRPSPLGDLTTAGDRPLYRLRRAELALRDDEVHALVLDVEVLLGLVGALDAGDPRRATVLRSLERGLDALDLERVASTAAAAREALAPALALPARASATRAIAAGHAHIDTAWLWPLRESVRKCARTFASAVRLMEDHPEHRFVCSQAAQLAWIEASYPELFARIRDRVATGQFVPVGGMWVEADMNLPSGESIVRQLVHGQRWFEQRFGRRCSEVWIPDVFGYPASLPQVFAAAGCTRFVTQKLSWNKQNRFPHHTFRWEGLDGTRVLTHFPPVDTYNAELSPEELVGAERRFRDGAWSRWTLVPFGYGNGGGGPTREMLGRAARMADLDGVPPVTLGTPAELFERIEAEEADGARVPVWRGELYFETHRGTLTSQSRTKVGNRRCERLLREAELWWATAGPQHPRAAGVAAELHGLWDEVLVQQFHDILPGSSIAWVHDDAEAVHERVGDRVEQLVHEALATLADEEHLVANVAGRDRVEVVALPRDVAEALAGEHGAPMQVLGDGRVACVVAAPAGGTAPLRPSASGHRVVTTEHSMADDRLAVRWDLEGRITSIIAVDHGRELLPEGRAISLELAPDHPVEYDAWDLEPWTHRRSSPLPGETTVQLVESGPLVASVRATTAFGRSRATCTWSLRAGSGRLDVEIEVDWREDERLLSLLVPLDVRADEASCGIQFGHVRRPTHPSSPWDAAKFEVCAHGWVDLAEPAFGVAVLDDVRYGHGLFDAGIRVSLLRAARYPDPEADRGVHRVRLAILPHGPGLHDVLREAEAFQLPLRVVPPRAPSGDRAHRDATALVRVEHPGVSVDAVKLADDGSGDVIVRLHEASGDRTRATVSAAGGVVAARRCDLLEAPLTSLDVTDGIVVLALRPFELVTLRLTRGA